MKKIDYTFLSPVSFRVAIKCLILKDALIIISCLGTVI